MVDELGLRAPRQEDVVDGDADLAGVEGLGPQDALGGGLDREVGPDDGRRLAAEFERHRRQVARGVGHHRPAGRARAGEQQMVEGQRREGRAAAAAVVEEGELFLGKYFGETSISSSARCREFSDILTIARLPAAKMLTSGAKLRKSGKFHGTMTPTTPSGCGMSAVARAGEGQEVDVRRRGFIQPFRRFGRRGWRRGRRRFRRTGSRTRCDCRSRR